MPSSRTATPHAISCDVVVIGAGPGGYVAAIRCAQLGLKTVCVDEWLDHKGNASLGGTCLNVGCIPSKALLESSFLYQQAKSDLAQHGITASTVKINLATMQARKNQVVDDLTQGIKALFKANKVTLIHGRAKITTADSVEVSNRKTRNKTNEIKTQHIIIATGSSPVRLPQAMLQDNYILDSAAALELEKIPKRLGIIGAGAIGVELGSIWSRLGSQVVLLEAMKDFLPMVDRQLATLLKRSLSKNKQQMQPLDIRLNARLISTQVKNKKVQVTYEDAHGEQTEIFDKLVIAVGRKPNSDRVFDEELGIEKDSRCYILTDEHGQTSVPTIYAIGDVVRGPMLAHKASEEGMMVAETIAGNYAQVNDGIIPSVIYTHPELAWVGKTEEECSSSGLKINVGRFPISASGRARAVAETEGLVKIISDAETDRVVGVHIFSAQASELIAQAVLMMAMQATAEDIALTMFAHPTLSESLHEAALSIHRRAIHIKN